MKEQEIDGIKKRLFSLMLADLACYASWHPGVNDEQAEAYLHSRLPELVEKYCSKTEQLALASYGLLRLSEGWFQDWLENGKGAF